MNKFILIIFSAFALTCCETVVDVDVPFKPQKLVVNSRFMPDSTWLMSLTKSKYILDEGDFQTVPNAQVLILEDGAPYDTLTGEGGLYYSSKDKKPLPGKTYEAHINAPGIEGVKTKSYLPEKATIKNANMISVEGTSVNQSDFDFTINFAFDDDPNTDNYYEVNLYQEVYNVRYIDRNNPDTTYRVVQTSVFTDDPTFNNEGAGAVIFDDKLINGREAIVSIKGYKLRYNASNKVFLHLKTLSKELYQYTITAALQNNASGDPFAQPVHVFTNIENGFGIFGGYNESVIEIKP